MKQYGKRLVGSLAIILLLAAGVGAVMLYLQGRSDVEESAPKATILPVTMTACRLMTFEQTLSVSGNVQSVNCVLVSARVSGTLAEILVDEGDAVEAGDTVLFRTDSLKLEKVVEVARQGLAVAESSLRERRANLDRLQADHEQKKLDVERFRRLVAKRAATARQLEMEESGFKQATAMLAHGRALIDLASAQVRQSESGLSIAEKDLADAQIIAPISGRVTQRFLEPGEMAGPGMPVLRIEDPSLVEISAFLPEEYIARIVAGETALRISAEGIDLGEKFVTYKGVTVHPKLRTFEIRCEVRDPPPGFVSGRRVNLDVILARRTGLGLPRSVILRRGEGTVLFVLEDEGTVAMRRVQTGLETNGAIEIVEGDVAEGDPVVSMGQDRLKDGSQVSLVEAAD